MIRELPQGTPDRPPAFVLNRGDCNGYGVLRNLAMAGIPVVSLDSNPKNVTFASRFVAKCLCPDWEIQPQDFIRFLVEIGKRQKWKPVLFATGDLDLLIITKHVTILKPFFNIAAPSPETAEILVNKAWFYRYLESQGFTHPKTYYPQGLENLSEIINEIGFPCIIKPAISKSFETKFHFKCRRVYTAEELARAVHCASEANESILVQEEILGTERYLVYMFFDYFGEPKAFCSYRKLRLNPIEFGNACVCETVEIAESVNLALRVLKSLRYRGLAEAEIQRDPGDHQLRLIEINARTTTQTRLSRRAGLNMEYYAYLDALRLPLPEINPPKLGIKWIHLARDLDAVFQKAGYLSRGEISIRAWLSSFRGDKEFAMLAWDDMLPFLLWAWNYFRPYFHAGKFFKYISYFYDQLRAKSRTYRSAPDRHMNKVLEPAPIGETDRIEI